HPVPGMSVLRHVRRNGDVAEPDSSHPAPGPEDARGQPASGEQSLPVDQASFSFGRIELIFAVTGRHRAVDTTTEPGVQLSPDGACSSPRSSGQSAMCRNALERPGLAALNATGSVGGLFTGRP